MSELPPWESDKERADAWMATSLKQNDRILELIHERDAALAQATESRNFLQIAEQRLASNAHVINQYREERNALQKRVQELEKERKSGPEEKVWSPW